MHHRFRVAQRSSRRVAAASLALLVCLCALHTLTAVPVHKAPARGGREAEGDGEGEEGGVGGSRGGRGHEEALDFGGNDENVEERALAPKSLSEFDTYPAARSKQPGPQATLQVVPQVLPDGQRTNAYLGVSANPVGHFAIAPAPGSQFNGSEFQCAVAPTNVTALANGCVLATNGGFFSLKTGQCIGDLVHKGVVLQSDSTATRASFGITAKGQWVAGYLSEHDLGSLDLQELITGVGWLVRNGKSFVNESVEIEGIDEGFVREIAPRTGIGFDAVGRLMLLEVDGEEDIKLGMDLWQFADLFLSLGAFSAVNIDGGGSSAVFFNGSVVDTPTCNDTAEVCVRPVTTITCVF